MSRVTTVRWASVDDVDPGWVERLDEDERERLAAKGGPQERARFIGAAVLMREALAEITGADAGEIGLERTCTDCDRPHGRPVPSGPAAGWHVSASHSGPYVLVAASDRPVGVDVELVRTALPSPPLLVRVLAEGEQAPTTSADFARLWSAKEAYLKALGTGLSTPLREVRVDGERVGLLSGEGPVGRLVPLRPPVPGPEASAHLCEL